MYGERHMLWHPPPNKESIWRRNYGVCLLLLLEDILYFRDLVFVDKLLLYMLANFCSHRVEIEWALAFSKWHDWHPSCHVPSRFHHIPNILALSAKSRDFTIQEWTNCFLTSPPLMVQSRWPHLILSLTTKQIRPHLIRHFLHNLRTTQISPYDLIILVADTRPLLGLQTIQRYCRQSLVKVSQVLVQMSLQECQLFRLVLS